MTDIHASDEQSTKLILAQDWHQGELARALFLYSLGQGAWRGSLYGALYGGAMVIYMAPIGWGYGGYYGLITGVAVGALDGLILVCLQKWRRQREIKSPKFITLATIAMPLVTFAASDLVLRLLITETIIGLWYHEIPALIAAFAAWQAARKARDWYFE